jgi:pimeloyl-ACP methyl ester carboxylesterase
MPHVDGVSHRYVDAGGLRMHVAEAGPEDGEPIVLLHGWPQHWYLWRDVVPLLSDRYRLVMPDLRGLGWTEITKDGYEKEQLARDVLALMDAIGLERVKLMGHDWGGYAGFLMCLLAPERIERYLALNIIHPFPTAGPRAFLNSWRMIYQLPMLAPFLGPRATRTESFVKRFLAGSKKGVFDAGELEAFAAPLRDRERAAVTPKYYRTFQAHDLPLLVRRHWRKYRLTVPTLMLHGTGDFAIPPSSLGGYEPYADDMRIEFVQDTGHFIVDARPDVVAARALEFFGNR